jgi:hypothetical protein
MMRELAQLVFDGKVHAVAEKKGQPQQTVDLGAWKAEVRYGLPQFGFGTHPPGNPQPMGGALIAELGDDQVLVTGLHCRVDLQRPILRVEEGAYDKGKFKVLRIWNGDQTDWGLNFTSAPQVLRVTLGNQ